LKGWKLLFRNGKLWLCLVVELQMPIPTPDSAAAGLDIGWRRTEGGIRFATLYEPATNTYRELLLDLQTSPKDTLNRSPFRIDLGPTRWDKHNITTLIPGWKAGDPIPNLFEMRITLQNRRDKEKEAAKNLLRIHLAGRLPAWFDRAGRRGLLRLMEEFKEDAVACGILGEWRKRDEQMGQLVSQYLDTATLRLVAGQTQVAHDVCRYLHDKGIHGLIVETSFLAKTSHVHDNEAHESLKHSQKYRHFSAPGRFLAILKNISMKYGIVVETHSAVNTTLICHQCNHLNPSTEKEQFACEQCGAVLEQDQNAAVNLSRFGGDPALAEWALTAGKI
jgi:hypothetical protein